MKHFLTISTLTAIFLSGASISAHAQTSAPASAESGVTVGAAFIIAPEYLGAKKERFLLAPTISYHNSNGFFAGTREGVGFSGKADQLTFSAAVGYRFGRRDSDSQGFRRGSDDLRGLGKIEDALTTRLKGSYAFDNGVSVSLSSELALNHRETGNTWGMGLKVPLLNTKTDQVALNVDAMYGDRKYNQSNFGVTSSQSANSGYKAFSAKAGFDQVASSVGWKHTIDKNWSVTTKAGVTQVVGNAADSPIVKKKTNGILATSINYAF